MWEPQPLVNLRNSTACMGITLPYLYLTMLQAKGRAIAEAVSRWLPTALARVRARVWQVGFVVHKIAPGRFSPSTSVSPANHISFHQLLHPHNHPGQVQ
jgi:hypothetical protein